YWNPHVGPMAGAMEKPELLGRSLLRGNPALRELPAGSLGRGSGNPGDSGLRPELHRAHRLGAGRVRSRDRDLAGDGNKNHLSHLDPPDPALGLSARQVLRASADYARRRCVHDGGPPCGPGLAGLALAAVLFTGDI